MISYIVAWREILTKRRENGLKFLELIENEILLEPDIECIIITYNSHQDALFIKKNYPHINVYEVEPNEGEWINISKCYNYAVTKATKPLIAPLPPDVTLTRDISTIIKFMFSSLGEHILRLGCKHLDEKGEVFRITTSPYIIPKKLILKAKGWDERMFNWGKEEDDLIARILRQNKNLLMVAVQNFCYVHLWHDRSWAEESDKNNHNIQIMIDNINNNGKNVKNSFW